MARAIPNRAAARIALLPCYLDPSDPPAKRALLRAGLRLFVEKGVAATTVRDIGRSGGYTNPAIFKHFATKEDLALQLFALCYQRISRVSASALERSRTYAECVRNVLQAVLGVMDEDLDAVLYVAENQGRFCQQMRPPAPRYSLLGQWVEVFSRGIREGAVADDVDPKLMAAAVLGLLGQFGRMLYFGEFKGAAMEWIDQMQRIVMRMGTHPSRSRGKPGH